jgi:hypothetical protein
MYTTTKVYVMPMGQKCRPIHNEMKETEFLFMLTLKAQENGKF